MKTRFEDRIVFWTDALNKQAEVIKFYGVENLCLRLEIAKANLSSTCTQSSIRFINLPKQDSEGNWIPRSIELWRADKKFDGAEIEISLALRDSSHWYLLGTLRNKYWLTGQDRMKINNWLPLKNRRYSDKTRLMIKTRLLAMADAWRALANDSGLDKEAGVEYLKRAKLLELVATVWEGENDEEE